MRRFLAVSTVSLVTLVAAGGTATAVPNPKTPVTLPARGTVHVENTKVGPVLADKHGRSLYARDGDTTVTCTRRCAKRWPPLVVDRRPTPGCPCVDPAKLGSVRGPNGRQVTYGGHPLYRSARDHAAGDTRGQGRQGFSLVDEHGDLVATPAVST